MADEDRADVPLILVHKQRQLFVRRNGSLVDLGAGYLTEDGVKLPEDNTTEDEEDE